MKNKKIDIKPYQLHTYKLEVEAYNVYDGDTLKDVVIGLGFGVYVRKDLRLARIQAPEIRNRNKEEKQKGFESKEYLISLLSNQSDLTVHIVGKGKYGRWIAEIYKSGESVSDIMLDSGFAKVYK